MTVYVSKLEMAGREIPCFCDDCAGDKVSQTVITLEKAVQGITEFRTANMSTTGNKYSTANARRHMEAITLGMLHR